MKLFSINFQFDQRLRALMQCVAILFVCAWQIKAIPLAEYHQNVSSAIDALETLQSTDTQKNAGSEALLIKDVRNLLPASQTIEMPDKTSINVRNDWLESKITQYEHLSVKENKTKLLLEISERLGAIENRLEEYEQAAIAASSKNGDKQKLNEILQRPEYKKPEKSVWQKWWDNFWKRDDKPVEEEKQEDRPPIQPSSGLIGLGSILRYLVIALALAVIGVVFWRFVLPLIQSRSRKLNKPKKTEPRVILGEELAAETNADDLLTEAEKLARSGQIRAAIRKGYIALLCDLSDRKILGLARHKTNRDYLRDVQKRDSLVPPMRQLTDSFERHWYGDAPADENDWQEFRGQYDRAIQSSKLQIQS